MTSRRSSPAVAARLEFRTDRKSRIEHAAGLLRVPVSAFARSAAEERAERVIREHEATTTVPEEVFDGLLAALDAPPTASAGLARAAERAGSVVIRD